MREACGVRARDGFSGRREVTIGLGVYAVYLLGRQVKLRTGARARATRNAARLVALEERLGIHVEPELQQALLPRRRLVAGLNVAYVTLNVGLTVGWLMHLYRRRDAEFHDLRRAAVLTTLGAQPVRVIPCEPCRPNRLTM